MVIYRGKSARRAEWRSNRFRTYGTQIFLGCFLPTFYPYGMHCIRSSDIFISMFFSERIMYSLWYC